MFVLTRTRNLKDSLPRTLLAWPPALLPKLLYRIRAHLRWCAMPRFRKAQKYLNFFSNMRHWYSWFPIDVGHVPSFPGTANVRTRKLISCTVARTSAQTMTQQAFQCIFWFIILECWMGRFMPIFQGIIYGLSTIYGLPFRSGYYGFATGISTSSFIIWTWTGFPAAVVNMYVATVSDTSSQILGQVRVLKWT